MNREKEIGVGFESITANFSELKLFPNPTQNNISLIIPKNNQPITVTVLDLQGKIVLSENFTNNNDDLNFQTINVSQLAKGVYILNFITNTRQQNIKITIQ